MANVAETELVIEAPRPSSVDVLSCIASTIVASERSQADLRNKHARPHHGITSYMRLSEPNGRALEP